ncbi:hypothetical protein HMPREF9374_4009 [Desmospora sp. 8437]|nr:hypothetical protein HMPREF9374_4009 [Desmospora sp. 8437]
MISLRRSNRKSGDGFPIQREIFYRRPERTRSLLLSEKNTFNKMKVFQALIHTAS